MRTFTSSARFKLAALMVMFTQLLFGQAAFAQAAASRLEFGQDLYGVDCHFANGGRLESDNIVLIDPQSGRITALTHFSKRVISDVDRSPGGSKLLFCMKNSSMRGRRTFEHISTVDYRGIVCPLLPAGRYDDNHVSYSPDGRHIVFTSNRSGTAQIYVCDANGRHVHQLTQEETCSDGLTFAVFCKRGWIVYWADVMGENSFGTAYRTTDNCLIDLNGVDHTQQMTNMDAHSWKSWRHDGSAVLVGTEEDPYNFVDLRSADGSRYVRLTAEGNVADPENTKQVAFWNADDSQIAFCAYPYWPNGYSVISVMNSDGSDVRQVTARDDIVLFGWS